MITYEKVKGIKLITKMDNFLRYFGYCVVMEVNTETRKISQFWLDKSNRYND